MSQETASLNLPKDLVESIVRDQVTAAIATQLIDAPHIARAIVEKAVNRKVDKDGKVSSYDRENSIPYLEWLVSDSIRTMVKTVLMENIDKLKPVVEKVMLDEMQRKTGKNAFVKMLVDSMTGELITNAAKGWNLKVEISGYNKD